MDTTLERWRLNWARTGQQHVTVAVTQHRVSTSLRALQEDSSCAQGASIFDHDLTGAECRVHGLLDVGIVANLSLSLSIAPPLAGASR